MEYLQIEAGKVKPNPFKKFIEEGKLNETIIEGLIEGFKQTIFHDNLAGRYNKAGEVELIYGHHRLEAVKRLYGKDYKINMKVYSLKEFSEDNMLIDMIRENLTQRGTDFKEMLHSIILIKRWLEGTLFNLKAKPKPVTHVQISKFISKSGKSLHPGQISKYLEIENKLDEDIKQNVEVSGRAGRTTEGKVGLEMAYHLAQVEKADQSHILAHINKAGVNKDKARDLIRDYKNSDKIVKEKVKKGKLDLTEVSIENMKIEIKKNQAEKDKKKNQLKVISYKKYLNEASELVGKANTEIYKACAVLHGLEQSGILYQLEWIEVRKIIEMARKRSQEYSEFINKLSEKI